MEKFRIHTGGKTKEIEAQVFSLEYNRPGGQIVECVVFEAGDICIDQIPVDMGFYQIEVFKDNEWLTVMKTEFFL
jgi:hypothetical protein